MTPLALRCVLLDIEGTTSSVSFVYDVMFPFVRRELARYVQLHWQSQDFFAAREQIARDAGHASWAAWSSSANASAASSQKLFTEHVLSLMDRDAKVTGLKQLQGLIWDAGFKSGELKAHVYDDVPPALRAWRDMGLDLCIYSSGSIAAQKLFFGHTLAGNLLPLLRGHYDTTTGPKREPASYAAILKDLSLAGSQVLFLSDVVAELDAAKAAGLHTALLLRPGNAPAPAEQPHRAIRSFGELSLSRGD